MSRGRLPDPNNYNLIVYFFGNAKLAPFLLNDKGKVIDYEKESLEIKNRIKHYKP